MLSLDLAVLLPNVRLINPPERPFLVLETRTTLVLDWDIETEVALQPVSKTEPTLTEITPYVNVQSGCCTISCTQDAVRRLEAYADLCKNQLWAVYETGKGVRALRLDKDFATDHPSVNAMIGSVNPDRKYVARSIERKHWAARVSHKEGRPDEEIRFLQWVGTGGAMSAQWVVLKLHHELLLQNGLSTTPFDALVEALEMHTKVPQEDYNCFY